MTLLSNLKNSHRPEKKRKRLGRGIGSNWGKTAGRGQKGAKSRSGYKRRHGTEGGQLPLYRKTPTRGFTNARFKKDVVSVNFSRISDAFEDGEVVSRETLAAKDCIPRNTKAMIKILAHGKLDKKVEIYANAFSEKAEEILKSQSVTYAVVN